MTEKIQTEAKYDYHPCEGTFFLAKKKRQGMDIITWIYKNEHINQMYHIYLDIHVHMPLVLLLNSNKYFFLVP